MQRVIEIHRSLHLSKEQIKALTEQCEEYLSSKGKTEGAFRLDPVEGVEELLLFIDTRQMTVVPKRIFPALPT